MEVFQFYSDNTFQQVDIETATKFEKARGDYYVFDPKYDVLCIVGFGEHICGILFLLKNYYGFTFQVTESEVDYQKIIETFELGSPFAEPSDYAIDAYYDGAYIMPERLN